MTNRAVLDNLGRPIRGLPQGGVVFAIVEALTAFNVVDLTARQYASVMLVGAPTVSFVQVMLENRFGWAFLRAVPAKPRRRRRKKAAA